MARRGSGPRLRWRREQWSIMWTDRGRTRERRTGTTSRQEAEEIFADWLIEQRERPQGLRRPSQYLIADCLADYAEEHGPHIKGTETLGHNIDRLLDWWDSNTIDMITTGTCKGYAIHRRKAGIKDNTIRRELAVLSGSIRHAVREGRLPSAPPVWRPKAGPPKDRWLTRTEAARLLRAAGAEKRTRTYLPLFILLGLYGGARTEAILSLRWSQVDLDHGLIDWNPAGRIQTTKGRSKIRAPRRLMTFLRLAKKRGSDIGPVIHKNGVPLKSIKRAFANAAIRANFTEPMLDRKEKPILDKKGRPRIKNSISPHILRHTSATWMAQAGVDLWQISGYLGHSVGYTTETYAHHHPDYMKDASDALDRRHSVANSVANGRGNIAE